MALELQGAALELQGAALELPPAADDEFDPGAMVAFGSSVVTGEMLDGGKVVLSFSVDGFSVTREEVGVAAVDVGGNVVG